jgi:hypothetical protein
MMLKLFCGLLREEVSKQIIDSLYNHADDTALISQELFLLQSDVQRFINFYVLSCLKESVLLPSFLYKNLEEYLTTMIQQLENLPEVYFKDVEVGQEDLCPGKKTEKTIKTYQKTKEKVKRVYQELHQRFVLPWQDICNLSKNEITSERPKKKFFITYSKILILKNIQLTIQHISPFIILKIMNKLFKRSLKKEKKTLTIM